MMLTGVNAPFHYSSFRSLNPLQLMKSHDKIAAGKVLITCDIILTLHMEKTVSEDTELLHQVGRLTIGLNYL